MRTVEDRGAPLLVRELPPHVIEIGITGGEHERIRCGEVILNNLASGKWVAALSSRALLAIGLDVT